MTAATTGAAPATVARSVHDYLAEIGRRGGKAGTGAVKRRTRAQAQHAAAVRWAKRDGNGTERREGEATSLG
jgi:hypothetical protein